MRISLAAVKKVNCLLVSINDTLFYYDVIVIIIIIIIIIITITIIILEFYILWCPSRCRKRKVTFLVSNNFTFLISFYYFSLINKGHRGLRFLDFLKVKYFIVGINVKCFDLFYSHKACVKTSFVKRATAKNKQIW